MGAAVVHFEIHVGDIARAKQFYETVFEWQIEQWGDLEYWAVKTGRSQYPNGEKVGIDGGMLKRQGGEPTEGMAVNAFVCTVEVEDVDTIIQKVEAAGGIVVVAKAAIPSIGWQAFVKDTEGNIVGLMQNDKAAS